MFVGLVNSIDFLVGYKLTTRIINIWAGGCLNHMREGAPKEQEKQGPG